MISASIVGGENTKFGDYPFMALLGINYVLRYVHNIHSNEMLFKVVNFDSSRL